VTAADEELLSARDEQHLERAAALSRVTVTSDRDFLVMVKALLDGGGSFPGLIFIQPRATIGQAVRGIAEAAGIYEPLDMLNRIKWIP
jgi:hypothetical protein